MRSFLLFVITFALYILMYAYGRTDGFKEANKTFEKVIHKKECS